MLQYCYSHQLLCTLCTQNSIGYHKQPKYLSHKHSSVLKKKISHAQQQSLVVFAYIGRVFATDGFIMHEVVNSYSIVIRAHNIKNRTPEIPPFTISWPSGTGLGASSRESRGDESSRNLFQDRSSVSSDHGANQGPRANSAAIDPIAVSFP